MVGLAGRTFKKPWLRSKAEKAVGERKGSDGLSTGEAASGVGEDTGFVVVGAADNDVLLCEGCDEQLRR